MKKYLLLLFAACMLLGGPSVGLSHTEEQKAQLYDLYGNITSEDVMARLDSFAIQLMKEQGVTGYLICYGPEGEGQGTGKHILQAQKDYLLNTRGLEPEYIQTIYGGRYLKPYEVETELWIVPHGAEAPELKGYESSLETIKGKFREYKSWDGYLESADGPPFGNVTLAALADILRQQPKSLAYIVAFNVQGAPPGTWRRVAKRDASKLQEYGIASDRIKIIYGGDAPGLEEDVQQALIQLWVLPPDAPPPVEGTKQEKTPEQAAHLGTYNDYILKYREEERRIFEGLVEVLRADARLSVCLIIRPRSDALERIVTPGEPPDIDALKLAEKWKSEMAEKYMINENRIIVMPVDADEINEGTINAWAVPAGVDLPNPYSSDEAVDELSQQP